jgi:hypothetical protein
MVGPLYTGIRVQSIVQISSSCSESWRRDPFAKFEINKENAPRQNACDLPDVRIDFPPYLPAKRFSQTKSNSVMASASHCSIVYLDFKYIEH